MPPALVLLSGGLDSATTLAIAIAQGYTPHALSFDYGQRHRVELDAARRVAEAQGVASHRWITLDLRTFGHSALTDDIPVPKSAATERRPNGRGDTPGEWAKEPGTSPPAESDIPITYVPARNTLFLAYALAVAETLPSRHIFLGVNAVDYSGYPDCRPDFIRSFQNMANLATRAGVQYAAQGETWLTLHTPLLHLTKARIIQRGLDLGVDYALTHSCYDPQPDPRGEPTIPCGQCDSCHLRGQGFAELGVSDPAH